MGEKYSDKGSLGSFCTSAEQFPNPEGVKTFPGYGADAADLQRGFDRPEIRELPDYEMKNYKDRWTAPKTSDLVEDGAGLPPDFEFRNKEIQTKGMLTRPRLPTER